MGVTNLLSTYRHTLHPAHIRDFSGQSLAVDISPIIYRGLYFNDYIKYVRMYMGMFLKNNCFVYAVFDGESPTSKSEEIEARKRARLNAKPTPDHWLMGRTITPEILLQVKEEL